jgi:dimethyl sulfoxide reductase membrane subunit
VKDAKGRGLTIAIMVTAVLSLIGFGLWFYQLSEGLVLTNMRNLNSWGLYITNFIFMVGLSAGGLIISSVPKAFGVSGFGGVSKVAVWTSICCTVLAGLFIFIDLGNPMRVWEMVVHGNMTSPLMWDMLVITIYLILSIVYLWAMVKGEKGAVSALALRVISIVALIVAVLVHSVTAWIFSLQIAHEFWNTALMAPWFVSSALVSGLSLVMVVVVLLNRFRYMELKHENLVKMAKFLGVFLVVDLYFFASELITSAFPGDGGAFSLLVTGPLAAFFWIEILFSVIAAVLVFTPKLRTPGLLTLAPVLAILAVYAKRIQIVVGGFSESNLELPTLNSGVGLTDAGSAMQSLFPNLVYVPSAFEFIVSLCFFAFGIFLLLVGIKRLSLRPAE